MDAKKKRKSVVVCGVCCCLGKVLAEQNLVESQAESVFLCVRCYSKNVVEYLKAIAERLRLDGSNSNLPPLSETTRGFIVYGFFADQLRTKKKKGPWKRTKHDKHQPLGHDIFFFFTTR